MICRPGHVRGLTAAYVARAQFGIGPFMYSDKRYPLSRYGVVTHASAGACGHRHTGLRG